MRLAEANVAFRKLLQPQPQLRFWRCSSRLFSERGPAAGFEGGVACWREHRGGGCQRLSKSEGTFPVVKHASKCVPLVEQRMDPQARYLRHVPLGWTHERGVRFLVSLLLSLLMTIVRKAVESRVKSSRNPNPPGKGRKQMEQGSDPKCFTFGSHPAKRARSSQYTMSQRRRDPKSAA